MLKMVVKGCKGSKVVVRVKIVSMVMLHLVMVRRKGG